jgi:2-oxoglutarate ferredoxin oxidoreductase subunit alpha
LTKKLQRAASYVPEPIIKSKPGSNLGVITIGSCEAAVLEALEILDEGGVSLDYMRLRGFPFDQSVRKFIDDHENCIVVEQNRDAQLRSLLILDLGVDPNLLRSVLSYGGFPLNTKSVVEGIEDLIKD